MSALIAISAIPLATYLALVRQVWGTRPGWWLPVPSVGFLASASFGLVCYLFPDGRFVPRWTRWLAVPLMLFSVREALFPDSPPGLLFAVLFFVFFGTQVLSQVYRYRRVSTPIQRQLQRSREILVTARGEERRRLRRDLHDGLGPTLGSLPLKLDVAGDLLERDPAAARDLLRGLKTPARSAVADIRRLVYELRPPTLDELGLVGAIREAGLGGEGQ